MVRRRAVHVVAVFAGDLAFLDRMGRDPVGLRRARRDGSRNRPPTHPCGPARRGECPSGARPGADCGCCGSSRRRRRAPRGCCRSRAAARRRGGNRGTPRSAAGRGTRRRTSRDRHFIVGRVAGARPMARLAALRGEGRVRISLDAVRCAKDGERRRLVVALGTGAGPAGRILTSAVARLLEFLGAHRCRQAQRDQQKQDQIAGCHLGRPHSTSVLRCRDPDSTWSLHLGSVARTVVQFPAREQEKNAGISHAAQWCLRSDRARCALGPACDGALTDEIEFAVA